MLKRSIILFMMAGIAALGVYAQAGGTAERIVGTWVDQDGDIWTFRADGYLTVKDEDGDEILERTRYAVTDTRMFFDNTVWDISMSADGRILIIAELGDSSGYLLTKRR